MRGRSALQRTADELVDEATVVQIEHAEALRDQGRIEEALELWRQAGASGRLAIQRIQSGGADVVAAHWGR